jgi:hypothetical protein
MTEQLWTISRGSYSDYAVVAVVRGQEEANQIAARMNKVEGMEPGDYDAFFVESINLIAPEDVRACEFLQLQCDIDMETGEVVKENPPYSRVECRWDDPEEDLKVWATFAPLRHGGEGRGRLDVTGWDPERVRKVYGDHKAALMSDPAVRAVEWRRL